MRTKYILVILVLLTQFSLKAQCTWHTFSFDGFEIPGVAIDGVVAGTYYGSNNTPQQYAIYSGSYSCYMNMVDCGSTTTPPGVCVGDSFFSRIVNICPNLPYRISAYFTTTFSGLQSNINISIIDGNNNVLNSQTNISCPYYSAGVSSTWVQWQTPSFTPTTNTIRIKMTTNVPGGNGNDMSMDNLLIEYCYTPPFTGTQYSQTLCQSASPINLYTVLANSPVNTGTWTGPSALTGGYLGTYTPSSNTAGQYLYTVQLGNAPTCPIFYDTVNMVLNAKIAITASPSSAAICTGNNDTITLNSTATTYTWAPAAGLSNTTGTSVIASPATTTTYTITGTDATTGCTGTVLDTVKVNPLPAMSVTPLNVHICQGRDTVLIVSGAATYTWSPTTGLTSSTSAIDTTKTTSTVLYTITGTSAAGCVSTITDSVIVNPPLVVTITPSNPSPICFGSSIQLKATGGKFYAWSPNSNISSTTRSIVTAKADTSITYTVFSSDGIGCSGSNTVTITVNPLPTVQAQPDTTVCPGQQVQLTSSGNGASYVWQPATGIDYDSISTPIATVSQTTIYTVTSTSSYGCTNTAQVALNTYALPIISITSNTTIPLGSTIELDAIGGVKYTWYPGNTLSDTHIYNPLATPTQNTTYFVNVISQDGCLVKASVTIDVSDSTLLFVPTAFTPNGDGINDLLTILARGIFSLTYFKIYDRWGELVFTSNDLATGWDGTFNNKPEPIGVYDYVLQGVGGNGVIMQKKGTITLLR